MNDTVIDAMMPMHLRLTRDGRILSAGPILRKMLSGTADFDSAFIVERSNAAQNDVAAVLGRVAAGGRIFLRLRADPMVTLRGHGAFTPDGVLLNFGFGITLAVAVRRFGLTDADFAPSDLAMEFLFVHEANQAVMGELARANHRLAEAREAAETLALTDPLTGLANRRAFSAALDLAIRNAATSPFALAQMDLDYFKQVNDRHGHAAGDQVLQHVAQILRLETRAVDRVGRIGGDEFLLLLHGPSSASDLENLARRIIRKIEEPVDFSSFSCRISASMGFSQSRHYDMPDATRMLADADLALYRAKEAGRGQAQLAIA